MRVYKQVNVLEAARARLRWAFERFDPLIIAISGGKDSTVLLHLAVQEAQHQGRMLDVLFLDQEAEYAATITQVRSLMSLPQVRPLWYQVPLRMTNATSYDDCWLHAWHPGEQWMRPQESGAITDACGAPDRFYPFFAWFEGQQSASACSLIGLRSEESLNRYRAVTRHPALPDIRWSTQGNITKLYPLYDWTFEDIWAYIAQFHVPYNKVYDWLYIKNVRIPNFRVSNLIHEKAFKCLALLQEFEPETYDALVRRLKGVSIAARYAKEKTMFRTTRLPKAFSSWHLYRAYLLETIPDDHKHIFLGRFDGQGATEHIYRQQVKQLLINDWENNVPVLTRDEEEIDPLAKWRAIL
jgi:predicted phosphoadenosine phosphosulfate sulfurtransferase